jgi:hypothetical protein
VKISKRKTPKKGWKLMLKRLVTIAAVAVIAMIGLLSVSLAQVGELEGGGRGYFMVGGNIIDMKALNSSLESKGYSKISDNNFISLGGGGNWVVSNVIVGGESHGLIGREVTSGSYKTSLSAGYGFFNLGYIVYSIGDLDFYPLLGLGGGGVRLKITEAATPSYDDVLASPTRKAELSTGGFLLNVALGTDYLLKLRKNERREGGLVFGLRAGYTFAPIKNSWELDRTGISGGPQVGITGPYINLMIGGGGEGKLRWGRQRDKDDEIQL